MGPIQSSVNQMIGTAAIGAGLYAQSPVGKRMAELRQLKVQTPLVEKQADEFYEQVQDKVGNVPDISNKEDLDKLTPSEREVAFNIVEQGRSIAKRRFELQPTAENMVRMQNSISTGMSRQEYAAQQAEESMQAERDRIQAQKDLINALMTKRSGE